MSTASLSGTVFGTFTYGNQCVSGLSLCDTSQLIQRVVVLVEAQSRRSCCAFCSPARICLSPCVVLSFFLHVTCTDDPHRHKCAIKTQVIPQLIPLSIHAVASLNKSLTWQCLRNLEHIVIGSHRKKLRVVAEPLFNGDHHGRSPKTCCKTDSV